MYEQFYGLREKPFSLLPDPEFLYLSKAHSRALSMLEYSLANESAGICVISGEIGSGKTTLIRKLLNLMGEEFCTGLLSHTLGGNDSLLPWVSMIFQLDYKNREPVELYENFVNFAIEQYARGRRTVLIIDEAQNLSPAALEELRMLSNINSDKNHVLQLILVGQPELRQTLSTHSLKQLKQRVTVNYHLSGLNQADSCTYIRHRLQTAGAKANLFTDMASKAIWYHSRGIPRLINSLCDMALVYGFAAQKRRIDIQLVNEVVNDRKQCDFIGTEKPANGNITRLDGDTMKLNQL